VRVDDSELLVSYRFKARVSRIKPHQSGHRVANLVLVGTPLLVRNNHKPTRVKVARPGKARVAA